MSKLELIGHDVAVKVSSVAMSPSTTATVRQPLFRIVQAVIGSMLKPLQMSESSNAKLIYSIQSPLPAQK
jgi:hypothetical protein